MTDTFAARITNAWYQRRIWLWLLLPFSALFYLISTLRRMLYQQNLVHRWRAPVPVIVVGNITVGGTGKTPLVTAVVAALRQRGYKPGIISRGYGSQAPAYPFAVGIDTPPEHSGDEPLLLAKTTGVPVVIDADRSRAAQYLLAHHDCTVIISDDGLQHYRLQRDIEIAVVDGAREFGNRFVLPAGPLREPVSRLKHVHFCVVNGGSTLQTPAPTFTMQLDGHTFINCATGEHRESSGWPESMPLNAVAGIGHPERFFNTLRGLGLTFAVQAFADHHHYCPADFSFAGEQTVLMTEKDAMKVAGFVRPNWWYLPVQASLPAEFFQQLCAKLEKVQHALPTYPAGKP